MPPLHVCHAVHSPSERGRPALAESTPVRVGRSAAPLVDELVLRVVRVCLLPALCAYRSRTLFACRSAEASLAESDVRLGCASRSRAAAMASWMPHDAHSARAAHARRSTAPSPRPTRDPAHERTCCSSAATSRPSATTPTCPAWPCRRSTGSSARSRGPSRAMLRALTAQLLLGPDGRAVPDHRHRRQSRDVQLHVGALPWRSVRAPSSRLTARLARTAHLLPRRGRLGPAERAEDIGRVGHLQIARLPTRALRAAAVRPLIAAVHLPHPRVRRLPARPARA